MENKGSEIFFSGEILVRGQNDLVIFGRILFLPMSYTLQISSASDFRSLLV